ncbi:MAG: hypothetical protein CL897_05400 [Dehalococcoidia bacterium]|nr:hypothetical protein [Dehalococcoidia bacterium]HCV00003.1 hypothetical protein [Dehalococcoidia bacterium]|tara:strand:+ start:947 stop:1468 length:522 start_codon:yes stop_codon:yes gene_type:complete
MPEDDTRSFADDRRRLLGELELERNQLLRNIETCRIRDIERPMIEEWSLKDIVGHVASWEAEVVSALRDAQRGQRPKIFDFNEDRTDAWNQDHVERKRGLTFWSVLEQLKAGRERLLTLVSEFDDAAIGEEGRVPNRLLQLVAYHDREHWHLIAAYLAGMPGVREVTPGAESN